MDTKSPADSRLAIALSGTVPLWIHELKARPWAAVLERLPLLSQIISEQGDRILYRTKKAGETATAFNALAEAVASLSFVPGGVSVFGTHWESEHPDLKRQAEDPAEEDQPAERMSSVEGSSDNPFYPLRDLTATTS